MRSPPVFGRSGRLFAVEHAAICPDIMCVGKALTGGYMTLAATLTSRAVAEATSNRELGPRRPDARADLHGQSACLRRRLRQYRPAYRKRLAEAGPSASKRLCVKDFAPARQIQGVRDVRCLGAIGVIELDKAVNMAAIQQRFVERGVWIRPFGKLVYAMPPFIINDQQLTELTTAMVATVAEEVS